MTKAELRKRMSHADIVLPEELSSKEKLNHFIFDFHGCFRESTNSKIRWVTEDMLKRKSITVKTERKSRNLAALSVKNTCYISCQ